MSYASNVSLTEQEIDLEVNRISSKLPTKERKAGQQVFMDYLLEINELERSIAAKTTKPDWDLKQDPEVKKLEIMFNVYDILAEKYPNYIPKLSLMSRVICGQQLTKQFIVDRWEQDKAIYDNYLNRNRAIQAEIEAQKRLNHASFSVSQSIILRKIIKYLQLNNRNIDFINKFEDGYCCGIATLWAFTKWLQTQPKTSINAKRDDYTWFKSIVEAIIKWDETKESLETAKRPSLLAQNFEQFIAKIEYFQHMQDYIPVAQGDLSKRVAERQLVPKVPPKVHKVHKVEEVDLNESALSYYVIDKNKTNPAKVKNIEQEYSIAALFTLKQLKQLLSTPGIIQNHKLIQIFSHNHAVALFKDGAEYYFFDPNCSRGEVKISFSDTIAELIFSANEFNESQPSPIGFRMFGFDKPSAYPEIREVLAAIKPEAGSIKEYADNCSGLHIAARTNSLASLQYYLALSDKVSLNEKDNNGWTALMLAANKGHFEIVQVLIAAYVAAKVSLNEKTKNGCTALMLAANKGHFEIVQVLIAAYVAAKVSLNEKTNDHWTALMLAASKGYLEIVQALIAAHVSLNEKDNKNLTALMIAANNDHLEVVQALIAAYAVAGVSINEQNNDGCTALMLAVINKNITIVKELINAGVSLDTENSAGKTALMLATEMQNQEMIDLLTPKVEQVSGLRQ